MIGAHRKRPSKERCEKLQKKWRNKMDEYYNEDDPEARELEFIERACKKKPRRECGCVVDVDECPRCEPDFDENVVVPPEDMAQEVDFETGFPISHEEFWGDEIEGGKIHHPNHYNEGIEAWDYIISHNMNFLEGNIVKYITRYKHKNGLEDLKKVRQYLDKLIETEYGD